MVVGLFALSAILILGALYHMVSIKKPGFYPPKRQLVKRAKVLSSMGVILLFVGIIFSLFR